jgi:hypothetical protein
MPPFRLDQGASGENYGLMITEPDVQSSDRICILNGTLTVSAGRGDGAGMPPAFRVKQRGEGPEAGLQLDSPKSTHSTRLFMQNGTFFIGQSATPDALAIGADGITEVKVLRIRGGADLAEPFDIGLQTGGSYPVPGMVMVIDREQDGKILPCSTRYDTAVAGVISGANGLAPGLVMKAEGQLHGEGEQPLALTGRVWCLADASEDAGGPIKRGDSLTTSGRLGHAMRAADISKAAGAVIGKAMTELPDGTGLVLVLVNLQ